MIKNFLEWSIKAACLFFAIMLPIVLILSSLSENPSHTIQFALGILIGGTIGCGIGNGIIAAVALR